MPNPKLTQFNKEWAVLSDDLLKKVKANIKTMPVSKAVSKAMKDVHFQEKLETFILNTAMAGIAAEGVKIINEPAFRKWYLNKLWPHEKYTLAQSIGRSDIRHIIVDTIQDQMKAGSAWTKLAKSITDKDLVTGKAAKHIDKLITLARRQDAPGKIVSALRQSQRQVSRLKGVRLKKAYQNIINTVEKGKVELLDKAVTRAVKAKARANAERIARTENSRAHTKGFETRIDADPDVIGYQSNVSSSHDHDDICTFMADADLWGMGPGVAPKKIGLNIPYHPNCECFPTEVYSTKEKKPKFDKKAGAKYMKKHQGIMTKDQRRNFNRNPATWERNLNNWEKPTTKKELFPERFVR